MELKFSTKKSSPVPQMKHFEKLLFCSETGKKHLQIKLGIWLFGLVATSNQLFIRGF